MKTIRWIVAGLTLILALILCAMAAGVAYWIGASQANAGAPICSQAKAPVCQTAPSTEFGPEMHFPGSVSGPAIAELWNPNSGFCALVKVNDGETLNWPYKGSWFQAPDVAALNARWPSYKAEFLAKPSNVASGCKVYTTVNDIPQQ